MLIRIRALYAQQPKMVLIVASILAAEVAINAWLLTHGEAVQHGPGVHACSMIFDRSLRFAPSLSAWMPLIYDTVVIFLTVIKCVGPIKQKTASRIVRTLLRDGLLYYSVIFAVNFVLAIMIVTTPPGIKNICAQLEQLLTVAMMSRITLSLKREALRDPDLMTQYSTFRPSERSDTFDSIDRRLPAMSNYRVAAGLASDFPVPGKAYHTEVGTIDDRLDTESSVGSVFQTEFDGGVSQQISMGGGLSERDAYELRTLRAAPV